jgi:hypothetical protein
MAPAFQYSWVNLRIGIVLATAAVASACVASADSSPHSLQQVRTTNPSVTYDYGGDEALLQAAHNATTFCSQYNSTPGPARITHNPNAGTNSVVFECGPNPPPAVVSEQAVAPNLAYSYRTDDELLAASRTADAYCANEASHGVVSNITPNTDGSKTVTFKCVRG